MNTVFCSAKSDLQIKIMELERRKHYANAALLFSAENVRRPSISSASACLSKYIEQFGSGFKRIDSLCTDAKIKYSYEGDDLGFKFVLYRPQIQSDTPDITLDVTLNGTEMAVYTILKSKPDFSRDEIADKISKTVRTVQRALDSLR